MSRRLLSSLKKVLEKGPGLKDFISSSSCSTEPASPRHLPEWLKTPIAVGEKYSQLKDTLRGLKLHTVSSA